MDASTAKARRIEIFSIGTVPMQTFHMTWLAFLVCFFAWFGIAPLMAVVRRDLSLTEAQVGWCIIASVAGTVVARLVMGWLCDRIGPRLAYTGLLVLGALPVMAVGLSSSFETFLVARLMIGLIGASFVITQYHTSVMFASNCVGTANAFTAGIGNSGAGLANMTMPLVFALLTGALGFGESLGWRLAMVFAGSLSLLTGIAYFLVTSDAPDGSRRELVSAWTEAGSGGRSGTFLEAARDSRVWALFAIYGACFGIELTIHNVAALYFVDRFGASLAAAGMAAGSFGVLAVFARGLGGLVSDRIGIRFGLQGRTLFLSAALLLEGLTLVLFSRTGSMPLAVPALILFGVFVHMSCGATYSVVPFVNPRALGSVAGIVGAGGNAGAVAAGFLFRGGIPWDSAFLTLGLVVTACSTLALVVRFSPEAIRRHREETGLAVGPAGLANAA